MRRVRATLMLLLTLTACERTTSPRVALSSASATSTSTDSSATGHAERLVRIIRFDCTTSSSGQDAATAFPWGQSLRNWMGGGPGGASWNADRLHCAAELQTPCTEGSIGIELHVGSRLAAERSITFSQAGVQSASFDLRSESWVAQVDQVGKASEQLPYRSAVFGLAAMASCTQPEAFGPGMGPRLEYADQDSFLAGFASGE